MSDWDEEDDSERLSVWDAAEIWASNGKDEDYMFCGSILTGCIS